MLTILDEMTPDVLPIDEWSEILECIKESVTKISWKKVISTASRSIINLK